MEAKTRKPIYRYYFLAVIAAAIVLFTQTDLQAIRPFIALKAEPLIDITENFSILNTMTAAALTYLIIFLIALSIRRQINSGKTVLTGVGGFFAFIYEALYGLTEGSAGKWTKTIFPVFGTIFTVVLISNWMGLVPGMESIGLYKPEKLGEHASHCHYVETGPFAFLINGDADADCAHAIYPFLRVAATDLNFTLAIALFAVIGVQVIGIRSLGAGYFSKFWNTATFRKSLKKPGFGNPLDFIMGLIDIVVGLLEIVGEISKIISFTFRLFGNMFAGAIILFVIGSLVPVFAQSPFFLLELFVGLIQAFVFGMLTMVFMSLATIGHGHGDEEHGHH